MQKAYEFAQKWGYQLDQNGKAIPLTESQIAPIANGLMTFSPEVLEELDNLGLSIAVVDPGIPPKEGWPGKCYVFPDVHGIDAGGYYEPANKTVVLRKDLLIEKVVIHEVGHAIDDALVPDVYSAKIAEMLKEAGVPLVNAERAVRWDSGKLELLSLYRSYVARCEESGNHAKPSDTSSASLSDPVLSVHEWSSYAKESAREYFAEGIAFYVENSETREILRTKDPNFYSFLEKTLDAAQTKKPE